MSGNSGNLVNGGAVISCPHGGRAVAASASTGVRLDGLPVPTAAHTFAISGCPQIIDRVPHPCTSVRWTGDRDGVLIDGVPVLLDTTAAQCFTAGLVPQGPPLVSAGQQGVVCG